MTQTELAARNASAAAREAMNLANAIYRAFHADELTHQDGRVFAEDAERAAHILETLAEALRKK